MEKMILSLKNLYMILMTEDFPIYSESVISRTDRKGQTMLRFWQNQLIEEFRCMPCGKVIWRNDGKRNRYTSYLCNRSGELKTYCEYAKELASQISPSTLLSQTARFEVFLSARKYRHDVLLRRIRELLRLAEIEDPHVTGEIAGHIREVAAEQSRQQYGSRGLLFQASYLLTVMTLYAAAGDAMDSPALAVLRDSACGLAPLWDARERREQGPDTSVSFLTVHTGLLQDNALPRHRFFGREEALFDLKEMASAGRKCLITGIGGIGKTELLRQLLRTCTGETIVDKIAVVPYENSLLKSFARAFPEFDAKDPGTSFDQVLSQLEGLVQEGHKLLLVLDNMNKSLEEDPMLGALSQLSCGVVATTRRSELAGFEAYHLASPSAATGALIFRDNYGKPLTLEDRTALSAFLEDETICHPLTLRLMARAAGSKNWTVSQLRENLSQKAASLAWAEEDRTVRLNRVYSQLYSLNQIPEAGQCTAELFSLLPLGGYPLSLLEDVFPTAIPSGAALEESLAVLAAGGWLDANGENYSMHPLIAQCLRKKTITEARIDPILQDLHRWLPESIALGQSVRYSGKTMGSSETLLYMAEFLTGPVSRRLMMDVLVAVNMQILPRRGKLHYHRMLDQMMKQCPDKDALVQILFGITSANWGMASAEQIMDVYRLQKAGPSVPRSYFLDFCLSAGANMTSLRRGAEAETLLKEVLSGDATPLQTATAYHHLTGRSQVLGSAEEALQWAQLGAKYVTEHPECGPVPSFFNISLLCGLYIKFGRQAGARELLEKLGTYVREDSIPVMKIKYLNLMGIYQQSFGTPDQALYYLQQQSDLTLEYYGKDRNYYAVQGMIALALANLNRSGEALDHYTGVLDYARRSGDAGLLLTTSSNLAALYLDMEKPENALVHLETAVAEGRKTGGVMLGEALKNTARAHRLLGSRELELACLQEACPILAGAYGANHPKAREARQRLEELARENQSDGEKCI